MKQTHTHTKSKKREKKRESVLILTENKEQKNERDFKNSPNFALSHKKKIISSTTKSEFFSRRKSA